MKTTTRRMLSLALAGTIIASAKMPSARAEGNAVITYNQEASTSIDYIVREGDTLGKIAERFLGNAACYEYLAEFNNIKDANTIFPGQVIKIPDTWLYQKPACVVPEVTPQCPTYEPDKTYTVQKGDTLYCIVRVQYNLKNQEAVDKLATYNNLSDPNRLSVGQVLLIPCVEKLQAVQQWDYSEKYNQQAALENKDNCCGQAIIIYTCDPANVVLDPPCQQHCHRLILKP